MEEQISKMTVIININMMEQKIIGVQTSYDYLNSLSLNELRDMQDSKIKEYNSTFKK